MGRITKTRRVELWHNSFSGSLPTEIGQQTALSLMRFHGNSFTGELPTELGRLTDMERLHLHGQQNFRTGGTIPTQLGQLTKIQQLLLPVRWLDAPAFSCLPAAFWPSSLDDLYSDQRMGGDLRWTYNFNLKSPLFDCDALAAIWASVAVAAALPALMLGLRALCLRVLRARKSLTTASVQSVRTSTLSTEVLGAACEAGYRLRMQVRAVAHLLTRLRHAFRTPSPRLLHAFATPFARLRHAFATPSPRLRHAFACR